MTHWLSFAAGMACGATLAFGVVCGTLRLALDMTRAFDQAEAINRTHAAVRQKLAEPNVEAMNN